MEPKYFIENRYSFIVDALSTLRDNDYEVDTPETAFEKEVQQQIAVANRLLLDGKYRPALEQYLHLRQTILKVLFPKIKFVPGHIRDSWSAFAPSKIAPLLVAKIRRNLAQNARVAHQHSRNAAGNRRRHTDRCGGFGQRL